MGRRRSLLIVGAGPLQLPAYTEAAKAGLRVVAIDRNPQAPGMKLADVAYSIDTRDAVGAIDIAKRENIAGVLTLCTDFPVQTVGAVNDALGLRGLGAAQALRSVHKGEMRDAFAAANSPIPAYYRVRTFDEAVDAAAAVGLPAIFKPVLCSGSNGIRMVTDVEDIPIAYQHAFTADPSADEILVEEFLSGPEVSVETVSFEGRHHIVQVTDKRTTPDAFCVEAGHVEPSTVVGDRMENLEQAVRSGLDALGVMQSTAHVEIKLCEQGAHIIEIGARLGGDYITTELVPRSTGVNMIRAAIALALGDVPDVAVSWERGAAIRYIMPPPGRVVHVRGVEEARRLIGPGIVEVSISEGEMVDSIASSHQRVGHVIAEGRTAAEAEDNARKAIELIQVEVDPEGREA